MNDRDEEIHRKEDERKAAFKHIVNFDGRVLRSRSRLKSLQNTSDDAESNPWLFEKISEKKYCLPRGAVKRKLLY